jgi:RNA polymerase sigma-70 factor (ECF subfamily)
LERFRDYLLNVARQRWDPRLQGRLDPADLVQQALLDAHEHHAQFRGHSDAELAAWLRAILAHNLADALRAIDRAREKQSLELILTEFSSRLQAWLAADQSSPGKHAAKQEQLHRLTDSLARLPADQREAVTLHHLEGLPLTQLARRMARSEASVAGLLRRGLKRLRELMGDQGEA